MDHCFIFCVLALCIGVLVTDCSHAMIDNVHRIVQALSCVLKLKPFQNIFIYIKKAVNRSLKCLEYMW
jgi:hypothetical protein